MHALPHPLGSLQPAATRRRFRPLLWVLAAVTCWAGSGQLARGQSFLEQLEAAVRQQLAAGEQAAPPATATEELPSPRAVAPSDDGTGDTQSILEVPPTSRVPAVGPVPPPVPVPPAENDADEPRSYLGLEAEEISGGGIGVNVINVTQDSPAWKAGFERGDRIMAIGGYAIANLDDMVNQLGKARPGQTVRFLVARNERNLELVAVLMEAGVAERIAGTALPVGPQSGAQTAGPPYLGVLVNDLSPAFRNQFGTTVFRGAAVTTVASGSPAATAGLVAGDVITAMGAVPIETARQLMGWLETARPGQTVDIKYQRGAVSRTTKVTLEITPKQRAAGRASAPASNPAVTATAPTAAPGSVFAAGDAVPEQPAPGARPTARDTVVPNVIPRPADTAGATDTTEVARLQLEIAQLRAELQQANERLEATQNQLKRILEGLGQN